MNLVWDNSKFSSRWGIMRSAETLAFILWLLQSLKRGRRNDPGVTPSGLEVKIGKGTVSIQMHTQSVNLLSKSYPSPSCCHFCPISFHSILLGTTWYPLQVFKSILIDSQLSQKASSNGGWRVSHPKNSWPTEGLKDPGRWGKNRITELLTGTVGVWAGTPARINSIILVREAACGIGTNPHPISRINKLWDQYLPHCPGLVVGGIYSLPSVTNPGTKKPPYLQTLLPIGSDMLLRRGVGHTCLVCERPWILSSAPEKEKRKRKTLLTISKVSLSEENEVCNCV